MSEDCVICGGTFACSIGDPSWAGVLRIARCRPGDLTVGVTGCGRQYVPDYIVSTDPDCSGRDEPSEDELERHPRFVGTEQLYAARVVAFHDSCWSILLDHMFRFTAVRYEKSRIAQALYDLVIDFPQGKDCLGINRFGRQSHEFDYFEADPDKEFTFTIHGRSNIPCTIDQIPVSARSWPDSFSQLPIELTYHLVSFLDSPSLCKFRLTSKFIASLCSPHRLPQEFWASRFAAEHEMGFVPPVSGSLPAVPDWRQLYFDVKEELRRPSQIGHLRSRRRVWNCISDLRPLMTILLQQDHNIQGMGSMKEVTSLPGFVATREAQALSPMYPLRRKISQYVNLDPQHWGADMIQLSISTITINSTAYMCGFRVRAQNGTDIGEVVSLAGYITPATETHMSFKASDDLLHVQVFLSSGGLLGLAIQTREMQDNKIWTLTGQRRSLLCFSEIISLDTQANSRITGIIFGFDSFKAISARLVEGLGNRASSSPRC